MLLLLFLLQTDLEKALEKTRSEANYEVTFSGEGTIGKGDPLLRNGTGLWWSSGVLILDFEDSGRRQVLAVRAGTLFRCPQHGLNWSADPCDVCQRPRVATRFPRVWTHRKLQEEPWMKADEGDAPGAAEGAQNPDQFLGALQDLADQARLQKDGAWGLALQEAPAAAFLNKLYPGMNVQGPGTTASVTVRLDPQGRIGSVKLAAATAQGTLQANLDLARYGAIELPKHLKFSKTVAAAIQEALR